MPNYYAHLKFGDDILKRLPAELSDELREERMAFDLGCQGPDPLFYYHVLHPSAVRREGLGIHRRSALPVLDRVRRSIEAGTPAARSYGAGFLCHLALDSACHGFIYHRAAQGPTTHMAMEVDFDRLLMERDGLDPWGKVYLPREDDLRVWTAAAEVYEKVTPHRMRVAYRAMDRYLRLLASFNGKPRAKVIEAVSYLPFCRRIRGITYRAELSPLSVENSEHLLHLAMEAEGETTRQVVAFFDAIESGVPIPDWFDRDFKGDPPAIETPLLKPAACGN